MEMEVDTLCCFVSVNSIQTGSVGDSEVNFFPNFKDGSFVTSWSVHVTTLGSFGSKANLFIQSLKVPATVAWESHL